jgi:hypothetical protein
MEMMKKRLGKNFPIFVLVLFYRCCGLSFIQLILLSVFKCFFKISSQFDA